MRFSDAIQDPDWLHAVLQNSLRDALIRHKAFGVAIAVWRDNDVVLIPPEEIVIPDLLPVPTPDPGPTPLAKMKALAQKLKESQQPS